QPHAHPLLPRCPLQPRTLPIPRCSPSPACTTCCCGFYVMKTALRGARPLSLCGGRCCCAVGSAISRRCTSRPCCNLLKSLLRPATVRAACKAVVRCSTLSETAADAAVIEGQCHLLGPRSRAPANLQRAAALRCSDSLEDAAAPPSSSRRCTPSP
ncbi:hypothetical protein Dimus_015820, partial [Dionaea muscipula]